MQLVNLGQSVVVAAFGAIFASFWALVAYRREHGRGWVKGRSECDTCGHQIAWWQNIPLLSYLFLRGRCHYCRARIPGIYFAWECLLAAWAVFWWWRVCPMAEYADVTNLAVLPQYGSVAGQWLALLEAILMLLLGAVLLWVALVDVQRQSIANGWLWTVVGLTLARWGSCLGYGSLTVSDFGVSLAGCLAVGGAFWLIDRLSRRFLGKAGIGLGDTVLVMILAWWLSPVQVVVMFLLAFWIGAVVSVLVLVFLKLARLPTDKLTVAFLPFIVSAFLVSYFVGEDLWRLVMGG